MTRLRNIGIAELTGNAIELRRQFVDVVTNQCRFSDAGTVDVGDLDRQTGAVTLPSTTPTRRAHAQLATRAGVPQKFYERLRDQHTDLWASVMGRLHPADTALYRCIDAGVPGEIKLRGVLSDQYQIVDNVDVITTMLTALGDAGLGPNAIQLTGDLDDEDGRLCMRVVVPSIGVTALELVADYQFGGRRGVDYPMIFAGLEISNHETGGGAFTIRPRALLQVCTNGMTRDAAESFRRVHRAGRLDEGTVRWSSDTREKHLAFVASAATDAIRHFVSPEFLRSWVDEAAVAKGVRVRDAQAAITQLTRTASLSDDEANRALMLFIEGADTSVMGLAHAVTALAQEVPDSTRQSELEESFWAIVGDVHAYSGT